MLDTELSKLDGDTSIIVFEGSIVTSDDPELEFIDTSSFVSETVIKLVSTELDVEGSESNLIFIVSFIQSFGYHR